MDDRGRMYEVDREKMTKKDMDTGRVKKVTSLDRMTEIPENHVEQLKSMNRAQRRKWLAQYKKETKKLEREIQNGKPRDSVPAGSKGTEVLTERGPTDDQRPSEQPHGQTDPQ